MAIEYNFKYMPLVGKLSGKSMAEQTETAINEIAKIVNDNTAQAEIINTLAEEANANSVEALEKANEALETSSRIYVKETGAVDLDSYCESQLIYINNIFSQNLPVASKGFLEVKTNDDKTEATQVFIDDTNKEVYTRSGAITETTVGDVTTYTASYSAWNKAASTNYVENMVLIRQNSTAYAVGDIARSTSLASYMLLECTSAGTTGASEPSFSGADVGDVITDGSVSWTIIEYASTDYVDDSIANLKNVYLPANYLPLSGGTITGDVFAPTPANNDNSTKLATTEFVNTKAGNYLPLTGGTMSGGINFSDNAVLQNVHSDNGGQFGVQSTSDVSKGAYLTLHGENYSALPGQFRINAVNTKNGKKTLAGTPTGSLTWNGQPIQTSSDKRLKQDFSDVPAEVLEAWGKVEWKQFKYKADSERKGKNCRFHTGLVAQDVKEVGEENHVDLLKYGILCHDVREATEEHEAVDLWTVRYEEALAMEVIYLRNEIKKLREEIKALRTE